MLSLPWHLQRSTGLSAQNIFDWTHKWMMKVIVQWICCVWKIDISLLSSALSVYSSPPLSWWNRAAIEWFHYSHHENKMPAVAFCRHWRALSALLWPAFLYVPLDGNFPCSWLDACKATHDFNFSFCPGHRASVQVMWVCAGVCLNVIHFMLVFTCLERFMSVGIQD